METAFYILIALLGVLLIFGLSVASYAGSYVVEKYKQTERYMASSFVIAKDFAVMTSVNFLDSKIKVGRRDGFLTDAYISNKKVVLLSENVYSSSSVAALAVAAHELGHALQDKANPNTLRKHKSLIAAGKLFGYLMMPLAIAGIIMFFARPDNILISLALLGCSAGIFCLALVLKIMTISIEKQASKNAIMLLKEQGILDQDELLIAKKLLNAALLTYIADFLRVVLVWTFLTKKPKFFS